jgi:DDE_Tnp_1-associated
MAYTLWDVLGSIADRRGSKGRQFPLRAMLAIAVAAMLAGANELRAIFRWGRRLKPEALALFSIERAP